MEASVHKEGGLPEQTSFLAGEELLVRAALLVVDVLSGGILPPPEAGELGALVIHLIAAPSTSRPGRA